MGCYQEKFVHHKPTIIGHRGVENIVNLAEGDWIIAEVVLNLPSGENGKGIFNLGLTCVH